MKQKLLSRTEFRESALVRDNNQCVICGETNNLSVHHIIERRLWTEPQEFGGYFLDNAATLCEIHHREAETTALSCEQIREACNINQSILPSHLYNDNDYWYDKWGNIILSGGMRLKGELFHDESVQKILSEGNILGLFSNYVKYPRTYHLPWSNPTKDDKVLHDLSSFIGKEVVVSEKKDGENSNFYRDHYHARSLEAASGSDRAHAKVIWSSFAHDIPEGWRVCAENCYAKHSIKYTALKSYLMVFSIWNDKNECLSWDDTKEWCELFGVEMVPELYRGIWDEKLIKGLYIPDRKPDLMEGYVVRLAKSFTYAQFKTSVVKMVRENHVQTSKHWRHQVIEPNELISS